MHAHGLVVVAPPVVMSGSERPSAAAADFRYRGIDRSPWSEIDGQFYRGLAPGEIVSLRREKCRWGEPTIGFGLCRLIEIGRTIVDYSNSNLPGCELLAVLSSRLPVSSALNYSEPGESLGIDPYIDGYGSLIHLGLFTNPRAFDDFKAELNQHGLFDDESLAYRYLAVYVQRTKEFNLEPIDDVAHLIDYVRLWSVT